MAYQKRDNRTILARDGIIDSVSASSGTDPKIGSIRSKNNQKHGVAKLMGANTLIGGSVHNVQGERLGSIKELVLNIQTGTVAYVVLSFGVRFTLPEKLFAIPWSFFTPDTERKRFVLDIEKDRFNDAPGFDWNNGPDMVDQSWIDDIRRYYGT